MPSKLQLTLRHIDRARGFEVPLRNRDKGSPKTYVVITNTAMIDLTEAIVVGIADRIGLVPERLTIYGESSMVDYKVNDEVLGLRIALNRLDFKYSSENVDKRLFTAPIDVAHAVSEISKSLLELKVEKQ